MLIDTHCHLNDPEAYPDPVLEVEFALENGVERLLVVGIEPAGFDRAIALADRFPQVHAIVGWHPNFAANYESAKLKDLERLLQHPKVVALGEIGLDYHWDYATPDQQRRALIDQLDLAESCRKPVVFHCRDAYADLLAILDQRPPWPARFHCFSGTLEDAQRATARDSYFGVDGPITYKNASSLREIVASLPRERVVIETDSPYMTPVPFRGKPNRPGFVRYVNEALAELWGVSAEESARVTTANAVRFFGLG
jgi:TatD DNase family protein